MTYCCSHAYGCAAEPLMTCLSVCLFFFFFGLLSPDYWSMCSFRWQSLSRRPRRAAERHHDRSLEGRVLVRAAHRRRGGRRSFSSTIGRGGWRRVFHHEEGSVRLQTERGVGGRETRNGAPSGRHGRESPPQPQMCESHSLIKRG